MFSHRLHCEASSLMLVPSHRRAASSNEGCIIRQSCSSDSSSLISPVEFSEILLEDLPVDAARESFDEVDSLGTTNTSELVAAQSNQLVGTYFCALVELDDSGDGLAPFRSGMPMTAQSCTAGCDQITCSTSAGKTLNPPEMIMSFLRSVSVRNPSLSRYPMSPV